MKKLRYVGKVLISATAFVLLAASPGWAGDSRIKNPEDIALEQTENDYMKLRRKLFAARQSKNQEEVEKLEKQFKEIKKERIRLLRATWQL